MTKSELPVGVHATGAPIDIAPRGRRRPGRVLKRVQRGGSFLCSEGFCIRYRPGGRGKGEIKSAASHIGFRCVRSAE